ncbi:MAG: insulinase family protein [Deltaproteobacteria bacterium]|nr:insulinase family protein [Deltaproteobacteria bacterium]
MVDVAFRAGTIYEPPDRCGLAHLVEHVLYSGASADTRYPKILETRGARDVSAVTTFDLVRFRAVMPKGGLDAALWATADRLVAILPELDDGILAKHRAIVLEERALRLSDRPYGLVDAAIMARLYPGEHPLRAGVSGTPETLEAISVDDVRRYIERYFVPANAIVTLVGDFDMNTAVAELERQLSGIPPGARAEVPTFRRSKPRRVVYEDVEPISRQPRVTLVWDFPSLRQAPIAELAMGGMLLTISTDGTFGTSVDAGFINYGTGGIFRLDVTLPHDKPVVSTQNEAEALLRYLTLTEPQPEIMEAALLAYDRSLMLVLDSLEGRASLITEREYRFGDPEAISSSNQAHWAMRPVSIQDTARVALRESRLIVHARPSHPRQPRLERE